MRGHFDRSPKNLPGKISLPRVEWVSVKRADCGDAQAARFGFGREALGHRFPIRLLCGRVGVESNPADRAKPEPLCPVQFGGFARD
jgi:hypothetical protein